MRGLRSDKVVIDEVSEFTPREDALTRTCPKCFARPGKPCVWLPRISHADRYRKR